MTMNESKKKHGKVLGASQSSPPRTVSPEPNSIGRDVASKSDQVTGCETPPQKTSLRQILGADTEMGCLCRKQREAPPHIVGHRGAVYRELENTREGFRLCAEWGCHAVELDVFRLKDDILVVFHGTGMDENPGDLSMYCLGMRGVSILDLTYEECQRLQFNPDYDGFPCDADKVIDGRIPTLEEVLRDLKPTKTNVKIELKGPDTVEPTLEVVDRLGMVQQCQFGCCDLERIKELRELRPQVDPRTGCHVYQTGALFGGYVPDDFIKKALSAGADEVHLRYDLCTSERIMDIRKAGLKSMAWFRGTPAMVEDMPRFSDVGNEDERMYKAVLDSGVDQLCVNRPDCVLNLLNDELIAR